MRACGAIEFMKFFVIDKLIDKTRKFAEKAQSAFTGTFNVNFQNPSYYRNGAWTAIPTAWSIYGAYSYYDGSWKYASSTWYLQANYPNSSPTVTFYYSSSGYLGDLVRLWG